VPPLLIQPYVENAIWHGLMHKDGQGNINIEIKLDGEQIKLIVEDDGIGREKAAETKSKFGFKKQSMGMKLTKDRIDLLNEMYNIQTEQKINDLYHPDGSAAGTQVEISIPLINHKPETP